MKKPALIAGIVTGAALCLGPLLGLLGTVVGMIWAFGHLREAGAGNPEELAHDISFSLYTTLAGIAVVPIGIILLVLSIIGLVRYNRDHRSPNAFSPDERKIHQ